MRKLTQAASGLSSQEWQKLKRLNTPKKIQDFLNSLPFNFERGGETYMSPQRALKAGTIHCFEGALIAALALWINGERPLLLDLKADKSDIDHVAALFKREGKWGAISKTNHAVLRYREPVYKSIRELVMSYFHEYFLNNGQKTLRSYSRPLDLSRQGSEWIIAKGEHFDLVDTLDKAPHTSILSPAQIRALRKADKIERKAGMIEEYKNR